MNDRPSLRIKLLSHAVAVGIGVLGTSIFWHMDNTKPNIESHVLKSKNALAQHLSKSNNGCGPQLYQATDKEVLVLTENIARYVSLHPDETILSNDPDDPGTMYRKHIRSKGGIMMIDYEMGRNTRDRIRVVMYLENGSIRRDFRDEGVDGFTPECPAGEYMYELDNPVYRKTDHLGANLLRRIPGSFSNETRRAYVQQEYYKALSLIHDTIK